MKKLLIGSLLCMALAFGLLPATSLAATPTIVMVGDINVTDPIYETRQLQYGGYITYKNGTLTLDHVNVLTPHSIQSDPESSAAISANGDLTIIFSGSNTVSPSSLGEYSHGIYVKEGTLTLQSTPSASLTVTGANMNKSGPNMISCGIYAYAASGKAAVLIEADGTITASGGTAHQSYGIYGHNIGSGAGVEITSGTVSGRGGTGSEKSNESYGIYAFSSQGDGVLISGGRITAEGYESAGEKSCGVYAFTTTDNPAKSAVALSVGELKATGGAAGSAGSYGIYGQNQGAGDSVTIRSGTVEARSGSGKESFAVYGSASTPSSTGKGVVLSGGSLTAIAANATDWSYGVYGNSYNGLCVEITGGKIIQAVGGDVNGRISTTCVSAGIIGKTGAGLSAGCISISGSAIVEDAHGGTVSTSGASCGLFGECKRSSASTQDAVCIQISGSAVVNASSKSTGRTADSSCGIYGYAPNDLTTPVVIDGGTVTATGGSGYYSYGVYGNIVSTSNTKDAVVISGGTLNANGDPTSTIALSCGICADNAGSGNGVVISDGTVLAQSKGGMGSVGVSSPKNILLTGGTITAVGNTVAVTNQLSFGTSSTNTWYQWKENIPPIAPAGSYKISSSTEQFHNSAIAKYLSVKPISTASVGNVTVTGTTGANIANVDVTLTLGNDGFNHMAANDDVSSWFNLPTGLFARIASDVAADANTATVTIYGLPTATSAATMAITIPATKLTSGNDVTVAANPDAKYDITSAPVTVSVTVSPAATFLQGNAPELVITLDAGAATFNATNNYDGIDSTSELTPNLGTLTTPGPDGKVEDGSIVLTLNRSYLNTLSLGSHALRVKLRGAGYPAYVEASISVTALVAAPKTGDDALPWLWALLCLFGGAGLLTTIWRKRRA